MKLILEDEFTGERITVNNVKGFCLEENETKVYTEVNGNKDMTSYRFWFPVAAEEWGHK